jgi:hypothetical protein
MPQQEVECLDRDAIDPHHQARHRVERGLHEQAADPAGHAFFATSIVSRRRTTQTTRDRLQNDVVDLSTARSGCGDLVMLHRQGEAVADAPLGLDGARGTGISFQFAPQPQDLHVDATVEHVLMDPRRLKQVLAR